MNYQITRHFDADLVQRAWQKSRLLCHSSLLRIIVELCVQHKINHA